MTLQLIVQIAANLNLKWLNRLQCNHVFRTSNNIIYCTYVLFVVTINNALSSSFRFCIFNFAVLE